MKYQSVDSNTPKPSFWTTLPGILTGLAAIIASITGLLAAAGFFHPSVGPPQDNPPAYIDNKITKPLINHIPISDAGLDRTVNEGSVVLLNGSKSYDPDGNPITYSWRQIEGPAVKLDDVSSIYPSFTTPSKVSNDTKLVLELTVKDDKGFSSNKDIVTIFIKPLSINTIPLNKDKIFKAVTNYSFLKKWGTNGTDNGQFDVPIGVAVDSSGNVYVSDWLNSRIQKFDSSGNFITKWGSQGKDNGQFYNPQGIAVDLSGNVYVADTLNTRIQVFSPSTNQ
jgi:hypothetical protein